jgi:phosphoglycolate phosphatase-like HAD superfamily hydrolase
MKTTHKKNLIAAALAVALAFTAVIARAADPLPSWNDTAPKKAIVAFVERVTKEGSSDFVPVPERVATFDNDGTLWAEQPMYFQFLFAMDRIKALAPQHPEWKTKEPFKSVLAGDAKGLLASGEKGLLEIMARTHAGMTTAEFDQIAREWFKTARHPRFNRPYNEMVYQPMLELLAYLRANGFKTFIVSGGGVEFMRAFAPDAYRIPPDQIVGSMGKLKYEMQNGKPVLIKLPEVLFIDDKAGKPEGIQSFIGQRPIFAFGNSDGDQQMLEWTAAGGGARFVGLVHHTDAEREWAYGAESKIGRFSDALMAEAKKNGWTVVSMKDDWKTIFPPALK